MQSIVQFVIFVLDAIAVHRWRRTRCGYAGFPQYAGGAYVLPPAQPGFVYMQVPAGAAAWAQAPAGQHVGHMSGAPATYVPTEQPVGHAVSPVNGSSMGGNGVSPVPGAAV